jgi:hypothetical protein
MAPTDRLLTIFYRHVHVKADATSRDPNKVRPDWFSHEICFRNLVRTVAQDRHADKVRIVIVYDSSKEDFVDDFIAKYYANESLGLRLQFIAGGSDRNSFLITLRLASELQSKPTDLIYLLENDYLHQDGWLSKVFEAYDSTMQFDYLSLYDHKDKYIYDMYQDLRSKVLVSETHHWRTAPSTCASFIVDADTLAADHDILSAGLPDYHFFARLGAERNRTLITPIPGLSTHSMAGYLSPGVNWDALAQLAASGQGLR